MSKRRNPRPVDEVYGNGRRAKHAKVSSRDDDHHDDRHRDMEARQKKPKRDNRPDSQDRSDVEDPSQLVREDAHSLRIAKAIQRNRQVDATWSLSAALQVTQCLVADVQQHVSIALTIMKQQNPGRVTLSQSSLQEAEGRISTPANASSLDLTIPYDARPPSEWRLIPHWIRTCTRSTGVQRVGNAATEWLLTRQHRLLVHHIATTEGATRLQMEQTLQSTLHENGGPLILPLIHIIFSYMTLCITKAILSP